MSATKQNKLYEAMLFDYQTTNKTDFKDGLTTVPSPHVQKVPPKKKQPPAVSTADHLNAVRFIGSMSDYKCHVPIDLMIRPKDIIRTNPRATQKPCFGVVDEKKDEVRRTRPRLSLLQAFSIDDIEDEESRQVLIRNIYDTEMNSNMSETAKKARKSIKAPLPDLPGPADPLKLHPMQPPYVPVEWRKDTFDWDRRQLRAHCDTTKEFWLQRYNESEAKKKKDAQAVHPKMFRHHRYL